jgi:hypothetical protein
MITVACKFMPFISCGGFGVYVDRKQNSGSMKWGLYKLRNAENNKRECAGNCNCNFEYAHCWQVLESTFAQGGCDSVWVDACALPPVGVDIFWIVLNNRCTKKDFNFFLLSLFHPLLYSSLSYGMITYKMKCTTFVLWGFEGLEIVGQYKICCVCGTYHHCMSHMHMFYTENYLVWML